MRLRTTPKRSGKYMGIVKHERVGEVFAEHDLFLLPSLGENYSHVTCEALSAGCPVLISDRTPWRNLQQKGVGWDVPLKMRADFALYCRSVWMPMENGMPGLR